MKPTPSSELALFALHEFHTFISDRAGEMRAFEADHRGQAEIQYVIRHLKCGSA